MQPHALLIICLLGLALPLNALAAEAGVELEFGLGALVGDTTYEIGGQSYSSTMGPRDYHSPLSRLEFPLNSVMLNLGAKLKLGEHLSVYGTAGTNVWDNTPKLKDSDWYSPDSLDLYSESDCDLKSLTADCGLRYNFNQHTFGYVTDIDTYHEANWRFNLSAGYRYEHFEFDCDNLYQSSPSGQKPEKVGWWPQQVISYEIDYQLPYVKAGVQTWNDFVSFEAAAGWIPRALATDRDHHILKSTTSRGDTDGYGYLAAVNLRCKLSRNWDLNCLFDYTRILTDGTQHQVINGAGGLETIDIEQEISSKQAYTALSLIRSF